ncbi:MAG: hypothetical protein ACTS7I_02805 [Candidatus Hodgkinia cicadicola]
MILKCAGALTQRWNRMRSIKFNANEIEDWNNFRKPTFEEGERSLIKLVRRPPNEMLRNLMWLS